MVACVQNANGAIVAIHRTFLNPDGSGKAAVEKQKMMLRPCAGGAVRFRSDGRVRPERQRRDRRNSSDLLEPRRERQGSRRKAKDDARALRRRRGKVPI